MSTSFLLSRQHNRTIQATEDSCFPDITAHYTSISDKYRLWNYAIADYCLFSSSGEEDVYLAVTPRVLAAAIAKFQSARLSPEEAESNFVNTVSSAYHQWVLKYSAGLGIFRRLGGGNLPNYIAFLALSVLAAYNMHSDRTTSANAYYKRLAELLQCKLIGHHPKGFDTSEFEKLWYSLQKWLAQNKSLSLAMPPGDAGLKRFIAFPLTHVPLRQVDIEKLPDFFAWAEYTAESKVPRQKIDVDISRWSGTRYFTHAGIAALKDERRKSVIAQIANELELWEGSVIDSQGRCSSTVRILFDIIQRQPQLSYLARRPGKFPPVFDDGVHYLESRVDGWYEPLPLLPEDGRALLEGFTWEITSNGIKLALSWSGSAALALVPSQDYTGFVSHHSLLLGISCAVLAHESLVDQVAEYLGSISNRQYTPKAHPRLPVGWFLFRDVKVERHPRSVPEALKGLDVESVVDMVPSGGLRLGRKSAWLLGAPPRLLVTGLKENQKPRIDGEPVAVTEEGCLIASEPFAIAGTHIIEVGSVSKRIEIVEPSIKQELEEIEDVVTLAGTTVALPRGDWTIIGATPGEVKPACNSQQGIIVQCHFQAVWAIEVGFRPGATVLCLAKAPPFPQSSRWLKTKVQRQFSQERWISVIYNAAIRRPRLASIHNEEDDDRLIKAWKAYVKSAREMKSRWKNRRR